MAGLTFVNQIGAVEGMNQAAPGTLIPDTFVRWSQDVLFDRAGLMRRRGPFTEFKTYKETSTNVKQEFDTTSVAAANERVLGMFSTYNPLGDVRIGMFVHVTDAIGDVSAVLRVFDASFLFLGAQTLPFDVTLLSIVSAKPALGGGLWISIASDPADATSHYQFFWRGGYGSIPTVGDPAGALVTKAACTFTLDTNPTLAGLDSEHSSYTTTIGVPSKTSLSEGQFVFVDEGSSVYKYVGIVASISTGANQVVLEKRPLMWSSLIDNNHSVSYTINTVTASGGLVKFNLTANTLFVAGDIIEVKGCSVSAYNTTHTIQSVSGSEIIVTTTHTTNGSGGSLHMNRDILSILDVGSATTSTQNLVFTSVRPYVHFHGRGLINTNSANSVFNGGDIGTSAEGHWKSAGIVDWNVYRASDNIYLGKVKTVGDNSPTTINDNSTGTFYADPGINIAGDEYIMRSISATNLTDTVTNDFVVNNRSPYNFGGLYTAIYAGYQWYGNFAKDDQNNNRVVFSASHDREAVDLSKDAADSIVFPGKSKFRGMGASSAGLLIFLEDRTYILRGNDRTNFSVEQLVPDGCLCPTSVVEYGGGVFWAAKSGIMFFDGASVRNLTKDNLGLYYPDSLDQFDPEQDRVIGFIHKDNLIMHYTAWKSQFDPVRYEPLYVSDWENTPALVARGWENLDPDFTNEDLDTNSNVPIYWDRKILNNPEESASTGLAIDYQNGIYALRNTSATVPTAFSANYIYMTDAAIAAAAKLKKWNGSAYVTVTPVAAVGTTTLATKVYHYTGTSYSAATVVIWNGSAWAASTSSNVLWQNTSNLNKYGPLRKNTSITFSVYLPTNAVTTLNNMDFRGVTNAETIYGLKTILGVNSVENVSGSNKFRARFIDIHPVYDVDTNGADALLIEKINIPTSDLVLGPDFYLQTKHFTVGDPILRKWFQRLMVNMLLYNGAMRVDFVDDDDNDEVDISKKKHKYWEVFTESGYNWDYLGKGLGNDLGIVFPKITSPAYSNWGNVEGAQYLWDELFTADFNRYMKRLSWRKGSIGFRIYQLNDYKKPLDGTVTVPTRVEIQGFSIGFKALRSGRV